MKRWQDYFRKEKAITKAIPLIIIMVAIALIFGSGIWAQFMRITGDTGEGYGYGYGYGLGFGWDSGAVAGHRLTGDAADVYGYGYGFGYKSDSVTYNATTSEYEATVDDVTDLILGGQISVDGLDVSPGSTTFTGLTFNAPLILAIGDIGEAEIASGTTFTLDGDPLSVADINFTGSDGITVSGLPTGYSMEGGAIQFGYATMGITVDPAITIRIDVGSEYDDTTLRVMHKTPGGDWELLTTCVVADGICEFETTQLSDFATATYTAPHTSSGGGGTFFYPVSTSTVPLTSPASTVIGSDGSSQTGVVAKISRGIKFKKDLKYKAQNLDVNLLQRFLIAQNKGKNAKALAKNGVTKYFGRLTESALKEYQTAVGLPATGVLDSATREYINALNYIINPVVTSGMLVRGSDGRVYIIKTVNRKLVKSYVATLAELKKYKKAVVDITDDLLAKYPLVK